MAKLDAGYSLIIGHKITKDYNLVLDLIRGLCNKSYQGLVILNENVIALSVFTNYNKMYLITDLAKSKAGQISIH